MWHTNKSGSLNDVYITLPVLLTCNTRILSHNLYLSASVLHATSPIDCSWYSWLRKLSVVRMHVATNMELYNHIGWAVSSRGGLNGP